MSIYEFTCHERHPSSPNMPFSSSPAPQHSSPMPTISDGNWDDGSQPVELWDDGSQVLDAWLQDRSSPGPGQSPPPALERRLSRHAALDSVRRTSRLFSAGGALDSQTTESQYFEASLEDSRLPALAVMSNSASDQPGLAEQSTEDDSADINIAETKTEDPTKALARVQLELSSTRRQLYEYVGRWVMARNRMATLERELSVHKQRETSLETRMVLGAEDHDGKALTSTRRAAEALDADAKRTSKRRRLG
ncbi:hypothetical protein BV20DRAFT_1056399 [Pilatotrama ljubarskyi]|nr:hypothetical protein BV20DRAFT_1056399 [Pilatotrama ljubarskyi]